MTPGRFLLSGVPSSNPTQVYIDHYANTLIAVSLLIVS
jgi:hypothetical protein